MDMSGLSSLMVVHTLMQRLIARACGLDVLLAADLRELIKVSRKMLSTVRQLKKLADIEFRAAYKARMLADYAWRWQVIKDLGSYSALDQWTKIASRREAKALATPRPHTPKRPQPQTSARKAVRTDQSGWFRLAPHARRAAAAKEAEAKAIRLPRIITQQERLQPICVTPQELDLRKIHMRPPQLQNADYVWQDAASNAPSYQVAPPVLTQGQSP